MKNKRQSEKNELLALEYMDFYKRARNHMESLDIYGKMKTYDEYWEGDINKPKNESDPGSNTNIIHPMVEGQVAMLVEQNISVQALPVSPNEVPFAKKTTSVLEFIKSRNKMISIIERHERRREKYGTGILRVTFDVDALGGAGLPIIEAVENDHIFIDPCITDANKVQEAEFIIETVVKSIYWAKQTYGDEIADKIQENFFPHAESKPDGDNPKYLHMLVWTRDKGNLRLVEMSADGVILSDSQERSKSFYVVGKYPYFITPLYTRDGTIWGKGDVELIMNSQDLINDLDDQMRINARLTGNPQRLIETGSGIDLDSLTNEPGLNIPVNSVSSVRDLQPMAVPEYVVERRNMAIQYEAPKISRFSDQMLGNKQQGVDTATEALALQQSGTQGIAFKKVLLQETLSDVFSYCLALVREFWTEEVELRVDEEDNTFIHFKASELNAVNVLREDKKRGEYVPDGTKEAEFDIKVSVGAGLPTNKAFQYNMIREMVGAQIITPQEAREYMVKQFGLPFSASYPQMGMAQVGAMPNMPTQGADIQGINANGQVMTGGMPQ